ncbi:MAG: hypothetical protein FWK04_18205 [Nostoc sp. GBBB01]|nr:hypothetical protein [Nostoc sp. GBBB01]
MDFAHRLCNNESREILLKIVMLEKSREFQRRVPQDLKITFEIDCACLQVLQALKESIRDRLQ